MPRDILIDPQRTGSGNPNIQFSGSAGNTLRLEVLSEGSVQFVGVSGSLLKISDFPAAGGALNSLFLSGTTAVTGSILPGVTGLYDLGSSGNRWANVYANSISGSLTNLSNGSSYLIAGSNVTIATGSSGAVTISAPNLAPSTSAFVTIGNDASLSAERSLTAGTGLSLTDGGANSTVTLGINDSVVATVSGTRFTGQVVSAVDIVASGTLKSLNSSGDEGGEIFLSKSVTNTSLNTGVTIDVYQNRVRIFETGGTNRGGYWDVTSLGAGVATNFLASTTTPGGSDTYVQFNDGGSFGGDADFTFTKATNLLKVTNISGSLTSSNVSAGQVVVAGTGGVLSGSNNFWWDNTNARVGIGTSSPSSAFSLTGTGFVSLTLQRRLDGSTVSPLLSLDSSSGVVAFQNSSNALIVYRGGTLGSSTGLESMRIDASGNVGIGGTITPGSQLDVYSSTGRSIRVGYDSPAYGVAIQAAGSSWARYYSFQDTSNNLLGMFGGFGGTNSLTYLFVGAAYDNTALRAYQTTGNVAIGNANDLARLYVTGSSTASTSTMIVREGVAKPTGGVGIFNIQNSAGSSLFFVSGSGFAGFNTATPAYNLDVYSQSRVISDTSPQLTLEAVSNSVDAGLIFRTRNSGGFSLRSQITQNSSTGEFIINGDVGGNASTGRAIVLQLLSSEKVRVDYNGNVGIGTSLLDSRLVVNGTSVFSGSVSPDGDGTRSLGSSTKRWSTVFANSLTGSLTKLSSGGDYLIAGSNITLTTGSNGSVTIASSSPAGTITGTGTANYVAKFTGTNTIGNGIATDNGSTFVVNGNFTVVDSNNNTFTTANSTSAVALLNIRAPSGKSPQLTFTEDSVADRWVIGSSAGNASLIFSSGNAYLSSATERMRIDGSGNVGIGTSTPAALLTVSGTIVTRYAYGLESYIAAGTYSAGTTGFYPTSNAALSLGFGSNDTIVKYGTGNNSFIVLHGSTPSFSVNGSDNVSIGPSSYTARLFVSGSSTASTPTMIVREGVASPTGGVGVLDVQNSAGSTLLFVSGSGRIGIGSSSPGYNLQIGNGSTVGTRTLAVIDSGYGIKIAGGNGNGIVQSLGTTVPLEFQAGNGNNGNYIFSSTGNVGIGTATVTSKLHVYTTQNDATATPSVDINAAFVRLGDATTGLTFNNGVGIKFHDAGNVHYSIGQLSGNFYMSQTSDNGNVLFSAARTDVIVFNSAGSVGVGTTSPQALLHVGAGNDVPTVSPTTAYVTALGTTNLAIRDSTNNVELLNYAFSGGGLIGTATSHSLGIRTANTTAMTIDTSQNVGIGTTLLDSKLVVNGTSVFSGSVNPDADNSRDLGSSTKRWRNLYSANISGSLTGSNVSAGQVVVAGIGGVLSGSNNFWWDNTNARVGIGTSTPAARLHVSDSQSSATVRMNLANTNANGGSLRIGYFPDSAGFHITSNGNPAHTNNPSTSITNDYSTRTSFEILNQNGTWNGSSGTQGWTDFRFGTSGNGALVTTARFQTDGNVGIGSTTTISARLQVSGSSTASTPTMVVREGVSIPTAGAGVFDVQNSAGTSILFVSGSGAVGIGTTVSQLPTHKLHVSGKIGGGLYLDSSLEFLADGTTELKANSNLKLGYLLTTVINSSGNVGIGTGTPAARLNVLGSSTSANTPTAIIKEGVGSPTGGVGVFDVQNSAGTSILFVTGSGGVGINTSNPSVANLYVSSSLTGNAASALIVGGQVFGVSLNTYKAQTHLFQLASSTEAMRIDSNGNVGIGTNGTNGNKLAVNGDMSITGSIIPHGDNARDLGSSTKKWRGVFASSGSFTTLVTTAATTSGSYSKTFASGESGVLTATITSLQNENKAITFGVTNGAALFDIAFVSSEAGFSVAKKYTCAVQYSASPITFKTVDTGPYTGADITVSFTKDSVTTTRCTFSHNYSPSANIAVTINVAATSTGNSGTVVTIFP